MSAPTPETLLTALAELDRVRAALAELTERAAPRLLPEPPPDTQERAVHDLLMNARRAVLSHPAAAKSLHDLLVAEGRRYAATPEGADLRERLAGSEAVGHLRRIWEALSLNVLEGPAPASGVPDAWAELLADVVAGQALHDSVLTRLQPGGA
jgi:hypothetical protein